MFNTAPNMTPVWSKALGSRGFRNQLFLTLLVFVGVYMHNFHYLRVWQAREGTQINDVILNQLPPKDFSMEIFMFEYCAILMVLAFTIQNPNQFVKGLQMFALLTLARTLSIYFFPLEPPKDMIRLEDPFAAFFLHTKDTFVTKDLFFSGHTSTLFLMYLSFQQRLDKYFSLTTTCLVAVLLLVQQDHYTIDVLTAPFFAYISLIITKKRIFSSPNKLDN